jgi:two-component system response regulator TctD
VPWAGAAWRFPAAPTGARPWRSGQSTQPDVVVLDLTLPGLDGLQVLEQARGQGLTTPVLILTARGTVGDRIVGLNTGADDYLPKPFDLDELEARLRALSRRRPSTGAEPGAAPQFVGHLRYEKESGAIYHRDQVLELTPRELALLQTLIAKPGHAVSKSACSSWCFPARPTCSTRPSKWWSTVCAKNWPTPASHWSRCAAWATC